MALSRDFQEIIVLSFLFKAEDKITLKKYTNSLKSCYFSVEGSNQLFEIFKEIVRDGLDYDRVTFKSIYKRKNTFSMKDSDIDEFYDIADINNFEFHRSNLVKLWISEKMELANIQGNTTLEICENLRSYSNKLILNIESDAESSVYNDEEIIGIMNDHFDELNDRPPFIPTFIKNLDELISEGFRRGNVSLIVAKPNMGKSTMVNNIIVHHAIRGMYKILYLPVEMGSESVLESIASSRTQIPIWKYTKGLLTNEEIDKSKDAIDRLIMKHQNIKFGKTVKTLDHIENEITKDNYDVVIIDLFERLRGISTDQKELAAALSRVQAMAKDTNTHFCIVQQLKRDSKVTKPPTEADIKNSGAYYEVADLVLALHRFNHIIDGNNVDVLQTIILKQRKGNRYISTYNRFDGPFLRILNEIKMNQSSSGPKKGSLADLLGT